MAKNEGSVAIIGDVHYGLLTKSERKRFSVLVNQVAEMGIKVIALGDLAECAYVNSVGDTFASDKNELFELAEVLRPIARNIVCFISGNHERRLSKVTGVSASEYLASLLGVKYDGDSKLLNAVGRTWYIIHGYGGGRTITSPGLQLQRLSQVVDADIYVIGHHHVPIFWMSSYLAPSGSFKDRCFICAPPFIRYTSYSCRKAFVPSATGVGLVKFARDSISFEVLR